MLFRAFANLARRPTPRLNVPRALPPGVRVCQPLFPLRYRVTQDGRIRRIITA